jgi:type IV secretory pathway VirB2 component (pilin)
MIEMASFCAKFWLNFSIWLMVLVLFSVTPAYAQAGNVSTITNSLQGLIDIMTGKTATLLAIIAIAGIGFLWMTGKISINKAAIVCMGIGVIFGAPKIVSLLGAA